MTQARTQVRARRGPGATAALLAVLAALLAGCSGEPAPEPEPAPPAEPEPVDPVAAMLAEHWVLPSCRQHRFILKQEAGAAQEGLPPDHEAAATGYADLTLRVSDCDALVQGNRSVQAPFRWAIVHQPLRQLSEDPADLDWFAREVIVPDADVAARLAAFGLPAFVGEVTVTVSGGQGVAEVVAPGLHYTATYLDEPGGSPVDQLRRDLHRGGTTDRQFWMRLDLHRTLSVPIDRPAVVEAEGGYLAQALLGGRQPCTVALSQEAIDVSFGELRF